MQYLPDREKRKEAIELAHYPSFNQLMYLVGKEVAVNRGKSGACLGKLVSVQTDYLAIQTKNNKVVYYRSEHISNLSESRRKRSLQGYKPDIRIVLAHSFIHLLPSLGARILTIDHGGPELRSAVVAHVTSSELVVVSDGKVVRLPLGQIRYVASSIS
jgi:hypothetical protein